MSPKWDFSRGYPQIVKEDTMSPGVERAIMKLADFAPKLVKCVETLSTAVTELRERLPEQEVVEQYKVVKGTKDFFMEGGLQADGPEEDPRSRLRCVVYIFGTAHHMDLVAVKRDDDGLQVSDCSYFDLDDLDQWVTPDKPYQTIEIGGREYVATVYPFCS